MVPTATRYVAPPVPGNRCHHDPKKPRLELVGGTMTTRGKPFPWLIRLFLERCAWLYNDRSLFRSLELGPRKRSERIEAMVVVLRGIGRKLDRLTLRSGDPNGDGTFTGTTMRTIAAQAGITLQRAYRALWDLRDAGYIDLTQPIEPCPERPDGSRHRGLAGIRRVAKKLFERFKLGKRLGRERMELWREERGKKHVETIAERRRLRRLFGENKRAAELAERTTGQLAGAATPAERPHQQRPPAPPRKVYSDAELAEQDAVWRAWRERQP